LKYFEETEESRVKSEFPSSTSFIN